jgi:uncharacterized protein (TIGR00730 family)
MNICFYGSSSTELSDAYLEKTYELGKLIVENGYGLVYGGGAQGLMGAVARGVRDAHGYIHGVAPKFFHVDGVLFDKCDDFTFTDTMRQRKQVMEEDAEAFIMGPGGFGTFEEFFEILTLKQLERLDKAIVVFNINGYYDPMLSLIENAITQKFIKEACRLLYKVVDTAEEVLDYIVKYEPLNISMKHLRNIELTYDAIKQE